MAVWGQTLIAAATAIGKMNDENTRKITPRTRPSCQEDQGHGRRGNRGRHKAEQPSRWNEHLQKNDADGQREQQDGPQ